MSLAPSSLSTHCYFCCPVAVRCNLQIWTSQNPWTGQARSRTALCVDWETWHHWVKMRQRHKQDPIWLWASQSTFGHELQVLKLGSCPHCKCTLWCLPLLLQIALLQSESLAGTLCKAEAVVRHYCSIYGPALLVLPGLPRCRSGARGKRWLGHFYATCSYCCSFKSS